MNRYKALLKNGAVIVFDASEVKEIALSVFNNIFVIVFRDGRVFEALRLEVEEL